MYSGRRLNSPKVAAKMAIITPNNGFSCRMYPMNAAVVTVMTSSNETFDYFVNGRYICSRSLTEDQYSMEKLLIATRNPGKFKELKLILNDIPYDILSVDDLGLQGDAIEDGNTYEENAFKKAHFFCHQAGGFLTLADDSGLEVSALKGELGLTTRRWGKGESASDCDWLEHFLEAMKDVPDRSARFVCYAVLTGGGITFGDKKGVSFYAEVPGIITTSPEAPLLPGLPLSSCFKPDGCDKVYAALNAEEKGRISHRGWAASKAKKWLIDNR